MKKIYLLDTNIISEFSKERPNQNVIALYEARKNFCAISAITWQELIYGLERMPDGKRKTYIEECLVEYKEEFEIIPYDDFAKFSVERKSAHDSAEESLNKVIKDQSSSQAAVAKASEALEELSRDIKREADLETLIEAKTEGILS